MNGYEIIEKHGIEVINHSLFLECSKICICGHHAKFHKNRGTAGICEKCSPYGIHNFTPKDATSMSWKKFSDLTEEHKQALQLGRKILNSKHEEE